MARPRGESWYWIRNPRRVLGVALAASLAVHVGAMTVMGLSGMVWSRPRLTDTSQGTSPAETVLSFAPPPPAVHEPAPPPTQPEPAMPQPADAAEPAEPAPSSAEVALIVDDQNALPKVRVRARPMPQPVAAPEAPAAPPPPKTVSFAGGEASRAMKVVYVVDASGAMASSLRWVIGELNRSVAQLDATQAFQVVVSRELPGGGDGAQVFRPASGPEMAAPTEQNRADLAHWLDGVRPGGRSNPLEGLQAALALKPELVLLLTHSIRRSGGSSEWGAGNRATLDTLNALNPRHPLSGLRPVVIKAIQFIEDDPTGLLQQIASEHGDGPGGYRLIPLEELK